MKIIIGTPMYGGQCSGKFTSAVLNTQKYFDKKGWELGTLFLYNESLIQRARNRIASAFMKTNFDYLIFIDADIDFEPEWIEELVQTKKKLIAGVVPMKQLRDDMMTVAAQLNVKDIEKFSGVFNWNPLKDGEKLTSKNANKPFPVARVGTAFMLIHRDVFEEMKPYCEEYSATVSYKEQAPETSYFNVRVKDGILMSEDFDFCERWREMGNEVYIAPWICTGHYGSYNFRGNQIDQLLLQEEYQKIKEKQNKQPKGLL